MLFEPADLSGGPSATYNTESVAKATASHAETGINKASFSKRLSRLSFSVKNEIFQTKGCLTIIYAKKKKAMSST